MSASLQSRALDSALSAMLIGLQIGGDLSGVLENTAATIREMNRLEGVIRIKTSKGRAQLLVFALFPLLICRAFGWVQPRYFDPLQTSFVGQLAHLSTGRHQADTRGGPLCGVAAPRNSAAIPCVATPSSGALRARPPGVERLKGALGRVDVRFSSAGRRNFSRQRCCFLLGHFQLGGTLLRSFPPNPRALLFLRQSK